MKEFKKYLSLILCVAMVLSFTLPNFATDQNRIESSGSDWTTTSVFNENEGIVEEEQTEVENDNTEDEEGKNVNNENDENNFLNKKNEFAENENNNNNDNNSKDVAENVNTDDATKNDIVKESDDNDDVISDVTTNKINNKTNTNKSESDNVKITNVKNEINNNDDVTTETRKIIETTKNIDDENISSPSEATTFEEENNIATDSDIKQGTRKKDDYAKLNTLDQFNYLVDDSAKLVDDTITLLKDVTLYDVVRFTDNINLDLNGYTITGPDDNYTLYVENNFTIIDSTAKNEENNINSDADNNANDIVNKDDNIKEKVEIKSFIKSVNYKFPVICAKNAKLNIGKIQILAADGISGGDAIYLYNSNLTIDGATIKGGNGFNANDDKGGDGGDAIVVYKSTKQNIINVNSGFVCGGNGGKGKGGQTPDAGAAISYNGIYQGGARTGKGLKGKKGGGNGGMAINIRTKNFAMKNLSFEAMTLYAGSAGSSIVKLEENKNDFALFGTTDEDISKHYYSLYDLDGKNYLTSLKDQYNFALCAVYAMCAQIETYIMMEFPEFVRDVCHKVTNTVAKTFPSRSEEINLSEVYFGMAQNKTPTDAFGNAGHSDAGNEKGWTWGTSTQTQVTLASTWRGLVFEDDSISDIVNLSYPYRPASVNSLANHSVDQAFVDSYVNKTAIHAKNMRIYEGIDYLDNDNNLDESRLLNDLKRAIVKNHGVYFGLYLDGGYASMNYTSSTGVDYGKVTMFTNYETMSGHSGHGMYIIGWDDDYEFSFSSRPKPGGGKDKGVFILKNSWDEFSLIPQTRIMNWASKKTDNGPAYVLCSDFMAGEYMPAFTKYENNYFYDTGVSGVSMNSEVSLTDKELNANTKVNVDVQYKKVLNVFKIRNDKEKALAASFYANLNDREYEVALYRVPNDTNETQIYNAINNESNKLVSKTFTTFHGVNVVDFDTPVDLLKGQYVAVVITADEDNMGRLWIDGEGREEVDESCSFQHTTTFKEKSFLAGPTLDFKDIYVNDAPVTGDEFNTIKNNYSNDLTNAMACRKVTNANFRIKLWTNNYVTIDAGEYGNIGGNTVSYYYPTLKATMSDLPIPTVTNENKKFVGYNTKADGTGESYDENSIYSLNIADYLKLYAQYENVEYSTEPSSTEPSSTEPSSTESSSTEPSVAPPEPSTESTTKQTTEATSEATTEAISETTAEVTQTTIKVYTGGGNRGGGSSGGGGGRTSSSIAPPEVQKTNVVSKVQSKSNDIKINNVYSKDTSWVKDSTTNKWKLSIRDNNNNVMNASTGFYIIERNINNTLTVSDTYYIDNNGNMLAGWLNTADDKWYFFENTKDSNEGKMALGWKKIDNDWYYFSSNGTMMVNDVTPDGYKIGVDGKFIQ